MKPLRAFVTENRQTITPGEMPAWVDHYSIPALDAGEPEFVEPSTIDSHKIHLGGGELLISRLNPRKPRVHLSPQPLPNPSVASTEFVTLRVLEGDSRYLRYLMLSEGVRQDLDSKVRSATRSHQRVEPAEVLSTPVPMTATEEQRRIADFLDDRVARIDRIISARHRQSKLAIEQLRSAVSTLMDRVAATYGEAALRRFCGGIEQGSSPVGEDRPAAKNERSILKTSAIQWGLFHPANAKAIPEELAEERFRVRDGDVLVVRGSGSADLVGDAATARLGAGLRLYLSDLTYRLRDLDIDPDFATLTIISARGRSELGARVRQGSGPAKARGDDILELPVPSAPPAIQRAIVDEVSQLRARQDLGADHLANSIALMTEYKQSLITAAVTGEIDVTTAGSGIPG